MNKYVKRLLKYLGVVAFVVIFSTVYNHYGRGMRSPFMDYAFAVPTVCGALSLLINNDKIRVFFNYGMWTLIAYSIMRGVFTIAGADSPDYLIVFLIIGTGFIISSVSFAIVRRFS